MVSDHIKHHLRSQKHVSHGQKPFSSRNGRFWENNFFDMAHVVTLTCPPLGRGGGRGSLIPSHKTFHFSRETSTKCVWVFIHRQKNPKKLPGKIFSILPGKIFPGSDNTRGRRKKWIFIFSNACLGAKIHKNRPRVLSLGEPSVNLHSPGKKFFPGEFPGKFPGDI